MESNLWANTAFMAKGFSDEERAVIQNLSERPLGADHLAVRAGAAGNKFTYVESWKAIELANAIFGFDGWYENAPPILSNPLCLCRPISV